ncbi:FAD:protein FMN transferase [Allochromatium vinosum]|uniref:FAD:protein FMN transferase n=1 Tax=Allochromatium vinosum TaxID=1049 RepID=UPI001906632A|nr:FAD:protein FMN transferase [Allochromatium vinosum]MBK1654644.1 thiamine biosynthesis protein ApbE [Allochromatium vinosum]
MGFVLSPSTLVRLARTCTLLLVLSLTLTGCRDKAPVMLSRFTAFETQVDVSLVAVTRDQAERAAALVAQDFACLERDWASDGEAMERVNRLLAQGDPFVPPPSVLRLVRLGQTLESESEGLVNLSIGRLVRLWGFDTATIASRHPPERERISDLVAAAPSMSAITIEGLTLRGSNPTLSLDLTPIARAQAIDLAIRHLKDLGVRNALVQAGSELRALGERSGQPWRVPVLRPSGSAVLAIVPLRGDEAMATVAEHDRSFTDRGRLYHAILDPRTGRPATGARSVTVLSAETTHAAAAARALFIAGPTDWRRLAGHLGVQQALLVDAEGRLHLTPAMAERLERVDADEPVAIVEPEWPAPVAQDGRQP